MTAGREAIGLPVLFLSVLLAGGIRLGAADTLAAPSPYLLLLGLLLVRVAIQSGAVAPHRLVSSTRSTLANVNGVAVLVTFWLAASQALAILIPETGVPRLAFCIFFLLLLLNTSAAAPDRQRLLRSLAVIFGGAFILKYVILDTLSAPGESATGRALRALLDAVTIGSLVQPPQHPAEAYLALLVLASFLLGIFLLPSAGGAIIARSLARRKE